MLKEPRGEARHHMHDEDSSLHRHQLVQLGDKPLVGSIGRDHAAVGHAGINGVECVNEKRDDARAIVGILIDWDYLVPSMELNDGRDGTNLRGIVECGTDEVRCAEGGERGACGGEGDDGDLSLAAKIGNELSLRRCGGPHDGLDSDVLQQVYNCINQRTVSGNRECVHAQGESKKLEGFPTCLMMHSS